MDDDLQLLYETTARMGAAGDIGAVIAGYLSQVAAGGRHNCAITLYEGDSGEPLPQRPSIVRVLGAWSPESGLDLSSRAHPYVHDDLDALLDSGATVAIADVHADARVGVALREIQAQSGRPALALIPMRVQSDDTRAPRRLGLVILSGSRPEPWRPDDLRRYEITAAHLAASLHARLQQRVLAERSTRLALLDERRRLARDLHDSVTQILFAIDLLAQSIPPAFLRAPDEATRRAERIGRLSSDALREMRALLSELRPVEPEDPARGLLVLADRFRNIPGGPEIVETDVEYGPPLPELVHETLVRIASEGLANAVRHARARVVNVRLSRPGGGIDLSLTDDGVGIRAESVSGMGLTSMRERASAIGATLSINPGPGKSGTSLRLRWRVPGAETEAC